MFDLERQLSAKPATLVQLKAEQSVEQRQRDVYHSHYHRIFALAFYMTGNELEAEEILASSFLRAFTVSPEPDGHMVDVALVAELQKRLSFGAKREAIAASPQDGLAQVNVRRTDMEEALQELPPLEKIVFLLRDVEGYNVEKISNLLELPSSEILPILLTARLRLRQALAGIAGHRQEAA